MTNSQILRTRCALLLCALAAAVVGRPSALAQQATQPAGPSFGQFVDSQGGDITSASDLTTQVYRRGTDPLTQVLRGDGTTPVTVDDLNDLTGSIDIAARPGGGTDVVANLEGLLPGEPYSFWAGYWPPPGVSAGGPHLAFGAITEAGDGSDNWMVADNEGKISISLVQQEGPMTLDGSASSYAPISPIVDLNGDLAVHGGYAIGIALHFGDYTQPPTPVPGPIDTWALHSVVEFDPIPEPSSMVLAVVAVASCLLLGLRRRRT